MLTVDVPWVGIGMQSDGLMYDVIDWPRTQYLPEVGNVVAAAGHEWKVLRIEHYWLRDTPPMRTRVYVRQLD